MHRKVILFTLICVMCLSSCGEGAQGSSWQEQYDLGVRYLSEANYEEAVIAFTAAIEIDPRQASAYVGRGDTYIASGETQENLAAAQADYEQAVELDTANADAYLGMADVCIRRGDFDRVLEILREGLEKTGGDQRIADKLAEIERGSYADSSGTVRRLNGYNSNGELAWYHIFTCNEAGQQTAVTAYDAAGHQTGSMELLYDEEGRQLRVHSYLLETGEIDGYSEFEYDSRGNMIRSEYARLGEEPNQYEVYAYNDDGICTSSSCYQLLYGPDGLIPDDWHLSHSTEYDTWGKRSRTTWYDDGKINGYYIYEYNDDGQESRMNNCDADGNIREYIISCYDGSGKFIGQEYYNADGSLRFSTVQSSDAS